MCVGTLVFVNTYVSKDNFGGSIKPLAMHILHTLTLAYNLYASIGS